jgi:cyclic lactone autoinducer peptide
MKLFAKIAAALGALVAATAAAGCIIVYVDEPEMPESMLK